MEGMIEMWIDDVGYENGVLIRRQGYIGDEG